MFEKKTVITALSGVLVGGLMLSGGLALATDNGSTVVSKLADKVPILVKMGHRGGIGMEKGNVKFGIGEAKLSQQTLDQLVKEGIITQAKADEIKAYIDKKNQEMQAQLDKIKNMTPEERQAYFEQQKTGNQGARVKIKQDIYTELVNNNILTQAQVDTIKAKLTELAEAEQQQLISDSLKALVDKGTVTQEQSDKILQAFNAAKDEKKALADKIDNMTVKEAREYLRGNKEIKQGPLEKLVADAVITQAQADAFQTTMKETAQKAEQQRLTEGLQALVTKGTLTQEQADKILAAIEAGRKDKANQAEKIEAVKPKEQGQHSVVKKVKFQDPISQLVTDGVITEAQAQAVREVVGPSGHGLVIEFGGPVGPGGPDFDGGGMHRGGEGR